MSWALAGLNLLLRLVEKPALARTHDPVLARARLEREARRLNSRLPATNVSTARIAGEHREIPVEWLSRGRPDRRRVILYLHGGAFIMGSPNTHRRTAAMLAEAANARAVVPDYALAPESPFPAGLREAMEVYRALIAAGYTRIALAGDSAGGGLCFSLLQEIRREGLPEPSAVAAFSPWTDMTMRAGSLRRNRLRDPMLPVSQFLRVVKFYLADHPPEDPLASPALAAYRDPPPTLIQASRIEILEDDARMMAEALRAGGGDVRLEWSPRTPHAWQFFANWLPEADVALTRAGAFLASRMNGHADDETADQPD